MKKNKILLNEQEQQELMNKEFKNKKVLNICAQKWFGPNPSPDELKRTNGYLNLFYVAKQRFSSLRVPELVTFINRYPNFNTENIPDATKYTLEEMIFLLNEYYDIEETNIEQNTLPEIFIGKNLRPTPERQEASKEMLWYNTNHPNLIINEDGFRVFKINNQAESMAFGHYLYSLINNPEIATPEVLRRYNRNRFNQWCITLFDESNMYSTYRDRRSYYFTIDESKSPFVTDNPELFKHYLTVIQYAKNSSTNFMLSNMFNLGDMTISQQELLAIFPKLNGKFDLFNYTEYDETKELGGKLDVIDRITEDERNPYAFFKLNRIYKDRYIRRNKILTKKKSWLSMPDSLKALYISLTNETNYIERFSTSELIFAIKDNKKDFKNLVDHLQSRNLKIGDILTPIYSNEFIFDQKKSVQNSNISLFQSRRSGNYGIFHKTHGDWLKLNGIEYGPNYIRGKVTPYRDSQGAGYIVEHYNYENNPEHNKNFYVVIPITGNKLLGYFMSKKMFDELTKKDDAGGSITGFVPNEKSDMI